MLGAVGVPAGGVMTIIENHPSRSQKFSPCDSKYQTLSGVLSKLLGVRSASSASRAWHPWKLLPGSAPVTG